MADDEEVQVIREEPWIMDPTGRSYWFPKADLPVTVCSTCHGMGHFDSCFDCGNRGYMLARD